MSDNEYAAIERIEAGQLVYISGYAARGINPLSPAAVEALTADVVVGVAPRDILLGERVTLTRRLGQRDLYTLPMDGMEIPPPPDPHVYMPIDVSDLESSIQIHTTSANKNYVVSAVEPLEVGDLIQITNKAHDWFPCVLIVKEIKPKVVVAFALAPHATERVVFFPIRLQWVDFTRVGRAAVDWEGGATD